MTTFFRNVASQAAILTVVLLAASAVPSVFGQGPKNIRIAVVDLNRVRREYDKAKKYEKEINKAAQELKDKLASKRKEIEAMQVQVEELKANSKARLQMLREMRKLMVDAKVTKELEEIDLRLRDFTALREVVQDIYTYVAEVAKRKGIHLVLFKDDFKLDEEDENNPDLFVRKVNSRKVIYVADELDLTKEITEGLNKKYRLRNIKPK